MSVPKSFTTKEVASLCCVSDATVKRWEDAGLLRSERTQGGHRRFRIEEVIRFQREQELGLKQSNSSDSPFTAMRRRDNKFQSELEIFHSLIVGSEEESSNILINSLLNDKPLEHIFDEVISPAMKEIGDLWFQGELTIAHEHLATRTVLCALHKLRGLLPVRQANGKGAICCSIEGDFHELPTHFVQMIMENQGFEVLNFGTNMPIFSLCDVIQNLSPRIICISATIINDVERISRDFREFSEKVKQNNTLLILGGRAFQDLQIRKRFPADLFAENFSDVSNFTQKFSQNPV